MIETRINGRFLSVYRANLLEYTVGDTDYSDGYILPAGRMIPQKLSSRIGLRSITMTIDFEGESLYEITLAISEVTAMLRKEARLLLPDGFCYWCEYDGASTPKQVAPWIMQVQFSFSGFRHGPMRYFTLSESQTVTVEVYGNYETPAVITVTPDDGVTEFTVAGITVENVAGPVTIDGIYTTITDSSGRNKYQDAPGMTQWPSLQPGENTITISDGVTVEIGYYPIYQ